MNRKTRNTLLKYGLTIMISGAIALVILELHGFSTAPSIAERRLILCDAFTVIGVVLMLFAALVALSNQGAFEGISYVCGYALRMLIPGKSGDRQEKYGDYVERKREKGGVKGYGFLFFVGAGYFLASLVFLVLFYNV